MGSLAFPVSTLRFEIFQELDEALGLRFVASAFAFLDIKGWRVSILAISEKVEFLVDVSELAAILGEEKLAIAPFQCSEYSTL